MSFLRKPTGVVAIERHPHVEFVVEALDAAKEMRAPKFVLAGDVAKGFERNGNFKSPTIRSQCPFRLKHEIRIEVFVLISPGAVRLHAERIEIKLVGFATVVESVEQNTDIIVVPDVIAFGNGSADFVRLVVTVKSDIKEF